MTSPNQPLSKDVSDIPEDPRIVEVVTDYLASIEKGQPPDRAPYLARYPELAPAIAQCLDGLDLIHNNRPSAASRPARPGSSPAPLASHEMPANPLGDFQIVRELARGGMGVVYEAVQLSLGRRVALKVLPFAATFDARQLQRFKNEAQAAALLHHTHIVPIYAVGCERGVHFYAMQLIDGQSLAIVIQQLRSREGMSTIPQLESDYSSFLLTDRTSAPAAAKSQPSPDPSIRRTGTAAMHSTADVSATLTTGGSVSDANYFRRVARLMVQAAEALDHAHQLGVIHRDIKPANLLVNSAGNLWITDFGLAQLQADTGLTRSGDLLGTYRYMSPEQTSGQRATIDHRTDIYSLGATFYELLTLQPVFAGDSRQGLLYQIVYKEPEAPRSINRAIPVELETIVLKAMSKNRQERYATAGELAADIQRFLDHEPILARRTSILDRVRKWSRRHPSAAIAGVLLLIVIAVSLSISNRAISREQQKTSAALEREKLRANEAEDRFRQARQAVDMLVQMSEEELPDIPMAQGTRKRLLETALAFYQDFIGQREGDAASQAELAAVEGRVRQILRELTILQREMLVGILRNPRVQADLGIDDDTRPRLLDLFRQSEEDRNRIINEVRSAEARRRRFVESAEEHEAALAGILNPRQLERLRQISIQMQGLFAFKDPDIVRSLNLTAEQRLAIRDIEGEIFGTPGGPHNEPHGQGGGMRPDGPRRERFPNDDDPRRTGPGMPPNGAGGPGPRDMMWRPKLSKRESVEKVLSLLTDEQRQRWNKMIGEPFAALDEGPNRPPPKFHPEPSSALRKTTSD